MGEAIEKILLKYGWEKVSNWECLFVHREKGLFFSVYVDDIKLAGKKQNIKSMWKVLNKKLTWENQHHPLIMYIWDVLKNKVKKQRYCGQLLNRVRIANFRGESREITIPSKSSFFFMVL